MDLSQCCVDSSQNSTKNIKGTFMYKGNLYIIDSDITIQEFYYYEDINTGKKYQFDREFFTYTDMTIPEDAVVKQKTGYAVKKSGYIFIEAFETKEEAENFIEYIFNKLINNKED
jgi:hypothetical protein